MKELELLGNTLSVYSEMVVLNKKYWIEDNSKPGVAIYPADSKWDAYTMFGTLECLIDKARAKASA